LDGVLAKYEGWRGATHFGEPLVGAAEFTRRLAAVADVVIFTTRCNAALNAPMPVAELRRTVQQWLDRHGFAYQEIYIGQGKPHAAAYVDDRAVECCPQGSRGTEFDSALRRVMALVGGEEK
jgi:hypothetical protein